MGLIILTAIVYIHVYIHKNEALVYYIVTKTSEFYKNERPNWPLPHIHYRELANKHQENTESV